MSLAPARRRLRSPLRRPRSEVPPPRERAGPGRRIRQAVRQPLDASRLRRRRRGREDVEVTRQLRQPARPRRHESTLGPTAWRCSRPTTARRCRSAGTRSTPPRRPSPGSMPWPGEPTGLPAAPADEACAARLPRRHGRRSRHPARDGHAVRRGDRGERRARCRRSRPRPRRTRAAVKAMAEAVGLKLRRRRRRARGRAGDGRRARRGEGGQGLRRRRCPTGRADRRPAGWSRRRSRAPPSAAGDLVTRADATATGAPRPPLPAGFWPIWTTVALDLVGFGIVVPILGLYAERFGATPHDRRAALRRVLGCPARLRAAPRPAVRPHRPQARDHPVAGRHGRRQPPHRPGRVAVAAVSRPDRRRRLRGQRVRRPGRGHRPRAPVRAAAPARPARRGVRRRVRARARPSEAWPRSAGRTSRSSWPPAWPRSTPSSRSCGCPRRCRRSADAAWPDEPRCRAPVRRRRTARHPRGRRRPATRPGHPGHRDVHGHGGLQRLRGHLRPPRPASASGSTRARPRPSSWSSASPS